MVFSSFGFVLGFLPITYVVFWLLDRYGQGRLMLGWLLATSLFFYGWWNPIYLPLLGGSVLFNFLLGRALDQTVGGANTRRRWLLVGGVFANLALLGYFKYAGFFVSAAHAIFGIRGSVPTIILPLAISFFTFQQIAYLVDASRGRTRHYGPLPYAVFVTFFPQLIAGPIVRHDETIPQLDRSRGRFTSPPNFAIGVTIFTLGLFKKVVLADGVAEFASPVFDAAARGQALTFVEAWGGTLAYTFQIYFDFSGYTDMAIGAARLFGIRLPVNFDSPYRAISIANFWERWHVTLSRFLRDYLYIPLGGNRRGSLRRYENLMITMLLGGLWHGAGWTFVLWGGLHGAYLIVNHLWRALRDRDSRASAATSRWTIASSRVGTFLAVAIAWVLFRATDLGGAMRVYRGMLGLDGMWLGGRHFAGLEEVIWIGAMVVLACVGPNTQELLGRFAPSLPRQPVPAPPRMALAWLRWTPSPLWAVLTALLAVTAILNLERSEEFLYFQF